MKYPRLLFDYEENGVKIKMFKTAENEYQIIANVDFEEEPELLEIVQLILIERKILKDKLKDLMKDIKLKGEES